MGYVDESSSPPPPKEKLRGTSCFSCCFRVCFDDDEDDGRPASLLRSSSLWLKQEIPELKERCRGLVSRIGGHRRRGSGGGFGYDPLSYALNFDDGEGEDDDAQDLRYWNFSSRLPSSPP